jgi:hypothetical protein
MRIAALMRRHPTATDSIVALLLAIAAFVAVHASLGMAIPELGFKKRAIRG